MEIEKYDSLNYVDCVEENSDSLTERIRVKFKNGRQLSIVKGEYSYGGPAGLFEIAPVDIDGNLDGSMFDEKDQGDDVLGYCNEETIKYYIEKMGNL